MFHDSVSHYYYHICEVTIFASTAELFCAFH
uniref:Uncharacterized protein n=1 Tax=Arundo donax TaxID=35708 RepID=A0A0A9F287_ARUDO